MSWIPLQQINPSTMHSYSIRLNKTFLRAIFGISIEKYVDIRRTGVNTWMLSFRNEDVCVTVLRVTENMVMIVDTNGFTKSREVFGPECYNTS